MIQRLDELTTPVEVGKYYLVPTIEAVWYDRLAVYPVIGPKHSDAHCLDFAWQHYHIDPRFVVDRSDNDPYWWRSIAGAPIMSRTESGRELNPVLPKPVWRRRLCRRDASPIVHSLREIAYSKDRRWQCHFDEWTGKQARHDGRGWVCPHRAVPLADHAPVDGAITCPLHMLRIDAETGVVLPPVAPKGGAA